MEIVIHLKELRERDGLSQKKLAQCAGVKRSQIDKIERGIHAPYTRTLCRLARALGCTLDELVTWDGDLTDAWL